MGWFQDAFMWPQMLTSGSGRSQLLDDIKYGKGAAAVGSPLHGLTAGYKLHELMSPTVHINDRIQDLRKNGVSSDHLKFAVEDQNHNLQDAFKENLPALLFAAGGWAGGGSSAGSAAGSGSGSGVLSAGDAAAAESGGLMGMGDITSGWEAQNAANLEGTVSGFSAPSLGGGTNWLGLGQQGLGLLGQAAGNRQQQQPATVSAPPPQQQPNNSLQQRVAMQKRIQQLRQKPRKTLAEQQELQELMRNSQGLL